ncbi:pyrimidine 5'-nucleotidase [Paracoccus sp. KCTC 42845]|uniref:Pyrimidine 5'-nucleotidase n=2 Tax=Paracoccus aerius TaxID=1915382 RepID=A0ABS1S3B1_9RHOB|nr:pyrimidine 5'-nucleotidase [Paracoccus aerius]MBL3672775.1 pyrimidine 5'-nucleotidase [Paracoccus aerius]GHG15223.1 pyrimidine 5'-nucleotidase [Paracoccus aerius]
MDFAHVDTWIFDLDNTLYPPEMALFPQIESRMTDYVMRTLAVERDAADQMRRDWWMRHGTTLAGLMAEHAIDPVAYLDDVHDIDFAPLLPAPDLAAAIAALPGRKLVHTNADAAYAVKVLRARGLGVVDDDVPAPLFEAIYGIAETHFHPKPMREAFEAVIGLAGIDPTRAAFFEDDPRNLAVPHELGMRTILVGPGRHGPDPMPGAVPAHVDLHIHDLTGFLRQIAPGR